MNDDQATAMVTVGEHRDDRRHETTIKA